MKLLAWGLTDVGTKRDHNEDAFLIASDLSLFAVADGMGGHQGGDRASHLAVEILEREVRKTDQEPQPTGPATEAPAARDLRSAARIASRKIFNLAQQDPKLAGMGTTLTALYFFNNRAYLVHVGDSRAYLFRDEQIEQLTEDHSWIEEQVRSGFMTSAEAQESSLKHIITRSVGFESDVEVDQLTMPFLVGDCFLLCSDGLSNYLSEEDLRRHISDGYYSEVPKKLVELANLKGGDDNITVVLVYVANDSRTEEPHDREPPPEPQGTEEIDFDEDEFDPYAETLAPLSEE
jgi:protein phosphatase